MRAPYGQLKLTCLYINAIASKCQVARAFDVDYSVRPATISIGTNGDESTQNTGISDEGATDDNR